MAKPTSDKKEYYFLVKGTVMFTDSQDEHPESVGQLGLNAVITRDKRELNLEAISNAHRSMNVSFEKRAKGAARIVELTIDNIIFLGHMTAEEFAHASSPSQEELAEKLKQAIGRPDLSIVPTPLDPMKGN